MKEIILNLFSSWIENSEYMKYKNILKIISIVSGSDKYCYVDVKDKLKLMGEVEEILGASHSLKEEEHQKEFIKILEKFIKRILN